MYQRFLVLIFVAVLAACDSRSAVVGSWRATSVDMSFAAGKIPPEKMEETGREFLRANAPRFELRADGRATISGGGARSDCEGTWTETTTSVDVQCADHSMQLEKVGTKLVTLPDRTFSFELQ